VTAVLSRRRQKVYGYDSPRRKRMRFYRDVRKAFWGSRFALPSAVVLLAIVAYTILSDHLAWLPMPGHTWLNVK
jgi:hypothetical protein